MRFPTPSAGHLDGFLFRYTLPGLWGRGGVLGWGSQGAAVNRETGEKGSLEEDWKVANENFLGSNIAQAHPKL